MHAPWGRQGTQTRWCLSGDSQAKQASGAGVKVLPPTELGAEPGRRVVVIFGDEGRKRRG